MLEQPAVLYGDGSADDVSDAALLLYASVMQVMELGTRVEAAASRDEFKAWHEGSAALRSIKDSVKLVSTAANVVASAVMAEDRDATMGSALDALIGCWDRLLVVEASLREISSTSTLSDDVKEPLHAARRTIQEYAWSASLAQLAAAPQVIPTQDSAYQASFRMDIPCSLAAAKEGSPQYEAIVNELLNTDATNDLQPVAVTSVSGEGGAGKTTTCLLALRDTRVTSKYKDGVFGFEIGLDAQEKSIIQKIASIVSDCKGTATAQGIRELTEIGEAARQARRFFTGRRILLYLDNVWPDSRGLMDLTSMASEIGSRVLLSTRSSALANDYTDRVVELGTLRLDVPEERTAAAAIFDKHLGPGRDHSWCIEDNVNEALDMSEGLPIAIATLAALIRNKLVCRTTMDLLGQVKANLRSPIINGSRKIEHKGLFAAMTESLDFLDRQWARNSSAEDGSRGLMTRRYASLHAVDRSEDRVDKFVLAIVWNTSVGDAEATAGEFFNLGLAWLACPVAAFRAGENEGARSDVLTLHDLQAEYSGHVANSGRYGITVEEVHETAVQGMFEDRVDINALESDDYIRRCEELSQSNQSDDDLGGRYMTSSLVRHLLGSLTLYNAAQRWPTILRLLSDARWLFMWQHVDGWLPVYNKYVSIENKLPSAEILRSVPGREVEILSEIGRAAREVPCKERLFSEGQETERAAADLFRRVHAMWREDAENTMPMFIKPMLRSLCEVAGEWWLRPSSVCHGRASRHDSLLIQFRVPQTVRCVLVGNDQYIAVTNTEGIVRLFDKSGMLVDSHYTHSRVARSVCVGRGSSIAEHRVFSASDDGSLVLWVLNLPPSAASHVRTARPIVVDEVEDSLWEVASSADGRVVVAGGKDGVVYLWVLNDDEGPNRYNRRLLVREHTKSIFSIAVSPDGATVLSGSEDRTCRVWHVADATRDGVGAESCAVLEKESEEEDRSEEVWSCLFADEGRIVVTGHWGGAVKVWRVGRETPLYEVKLGELGVFSLAVIGDSGREVVAGTTNGTSHVVRVRDGAVTAEIGRGDFDTVRGVSTPRSNRRVVACTHDSGRVELWDLECLSTGTETSASASAREDQPKRTSRVLSVSSSPCGRIVGSGHEDRVVRCWSGRSGRCLWEYKHESAVVCVCVSRHAEHIAYGCEYGAVTVLDARTGSVVRRWVHTQPVFAVSLYKLTEGFVWSGHSNGEVVAWSVSQDSPVHVRAEHDTFVDNLAVSADGLSAYARDRAGDISKLRIVGDKVQAVSATPDGNESEDWEPNGVFYAELAAHGHRTAGHWRQHDRVRLDCEGEVHDVLVRYAQHFCGLEMSLEIPSREHAITCTADFDSIVYSIDAVVSPSDDDGRSFAQIVCGLCDGRVCILRQPLKRGFEAYNAAQSWERCLGDEQSVADGSVEDDESGVRSDTSGCFGCLGSLSWSTCHS